LGVALGDVVGVYRRHPQEPFSSISLGYDYGGTRKDPLWQAVSGSAHWTHVRGLLWAPAGSILVSSLGLDRIHFGRLSRV
jgi:hypothetical protein